MWFCPIREVFYQVQTPCSPCCHVYVLTTLRTRLPAPGQQPLCAQPPHLSLGAPTDELWKEGKGLSSKKSLGVFTIFIIIIIAIIICLYYFSDKLRNHSHKGYTNSIAFHHLCVRGPGDWGEAPWRPRLYPSHIPWPVADVPYWICQMNDFTSHFLQLDFIIQKKKSTLSVCCQDGAVFRQGSTPRWGKAEPRVCDICGLLPNLLLDSALSMAQHASLWTISPVISNTPNQSPSSQVFCFPSET